MPPRQRFRLTHPPDPSEDQEHVKLAAALRLFLGTPGATNAHGIVWFTIEHGKNASAAEGARRKACGVVRGIPDVCLRWSWRTYWIELKRVRGGVVSDAQLAMHVTLRGLGDAVFVAEGADAALAWLAEQGFPLRGRISA